MYAILCNALNASRIPPATFFSDCDFWLNSWPFHVAQIKHKSSARDNADGVGYVNGSQTDGTEAPLRDTVILSVLGCIAGGTELSKTDSLWLA